MDSIFAIDLKAEELSFVATTLKIGLPTGVVPGPLLDAGESGEKRAQLLQALAARHYLQVQSDGAPVLDMTVAALVGSLAYAETVLTASTWTEGTAQPKVRRLYVAHGLLVEHEQDAEGRHTLTAVRDAETEGERLTGWLGLKKQPAAAREGFSLPEAVLTQARYLLAGDSESACQSALEQAGASTMLAMDFTQALAHPMRQSVVEIQQIEGRKIRRIGRLMLIEGLYGLWLIRLQGLEGEALAEVIPCPAAEVCKAVMTLVQTAVPVTA